MPRHDPIFVCGFANTGTTLVSHMFNNLPDVHLDLELHFAPWLLNLLQNVENCGAIQTDVNYPMAVRLRELAANDFEMFHDAIRDLFCKLHTGYPFGWRWGNNCKAVIDHVPRVKHMFPNSTIIFMLRDPRDVWASVKQQWPCQEYDFSFFKHRYREMYDRSLVPDVHTVLYRDAIADPQCVFDVIDREFTTDCQISTRYEECDRKELPFDEIAEIEKLFPDVIANHFT